MTTFTVQVKDSDAEGQVERVIRDNKSKLTKEIATALIQVKQIQEKEINSLSLNDI